MVQEEAAFMQQQNPQAAAAAAATAATLNLHQHQQVCLISPSLLYVPYRAGKLLTLVGCTCNLPHTKPFFVLPFSLQIAAF